MWSCMTKVDECICCKEIGATQAESETGTTYALSNNKTVMFCILSAHAECWTLGYQPPHETYFKHKSL